MEVADALIPMTKEIIRHAGGQGMREVVVGMAHRGRLNMLVNVLGKSRKTPFDEFAGKHDETWVLVMLNTTKVSLRISRHQGNVHLKH
ncbi:hypothetical protein OH492_06170 [Vibrio chagasii]|nr:hypothetical protein [Vibrio chagasii]